MAVPYNLLPIEAHLAMITAEQANIAVLTDAARMWTESRAWIENASAELHTRVGELSPTWQDDAGRAHEEKAQRSLAELKFWGERIDLAQPAETLTTLAGGIQETMQEVSLLHSQYMAAMSSPLTAWAAPLIQQASGARMTALGAQFDMSMLKVVSASGIQQPDHMMPEMPQPAAEGNSPADFIKAAEAGMNALSELQGLAESAGVGGGSGGTLPEGSLPNIPGYDGSSGVSLAGLAPLPTAAGAVPALGGLGGLPGGSGAPPVPTGLLGGIGVASGMAGLPVAAKPIGTKKAPSLASEIQPGAASPSTAKAAATPMSPMSSPHTGAQNTASTLRPSSGDQPTGRNGSAKRASSGKSDGVPAKLRGRAANTPEAGFTLARGRRPDSR
ncbi:hypothetical protein [Amycolatopsis azurea]|uniref:PPE family domain-containing protein n=1 Tax=Amycolatopsis azurea DSM 43854 TaxID=1238180 RepID=M2QHZ8_9PSEU|nr:hypothetical protein [Amycolatopsis azurea]EMD26321.1 hypothetical protein C791_3623 [Amycolatopsis azurea DSM 43854]OOC07741.1 hypothetical protein B0293_06310 [Amycolatopsis azurea DSM 43854]